MDIGDLRAKIAHLPATQKITYIKRPFDENDTEFSVLADIAEDYDPDGYATLIFEDA